MSEIPDSNSVILPDANPTFYGQTITTTTTTTTPEPQVVCIGCKGEKLQTLYNGARIICPVCGGSGFWNPPKISTPTPWPYYPLYPWIEPYKPIEPYYPYPYPGIQPYWTYSNSTNEKNNNSYVVRCKNG